MFTRGYQLDKFCIIFRCVSLIRVPNDMTQILRRLRLVIFQFAKVTKTRGKKKAI